QKQFPKQVVHATTPHAPTFPDESCEHTIALHGASMTDLNARAGDEKGPSSLPHLCLVSDQLLPNLIPALMQRPPWVHLVVSTAMAAQGERLRRLLEARDIAVTVHP